MAAKNNTDIGFEKQIWDAACVLWGHIPAAEYRKVIVGLIFLRYISSAFEKRYEELIKVICTHFPGHILFTSLNTWMLPCILQGASILFFSESFYYCNS